MRIRMRARACTPVIVLGTSCERTIIRNRLTSQNRRVTSGPKVTHPAPRAAELPKPSCGCGSAHARKRRGVQTGTPNGPLKAEGCEDGGESDV